MRLHRDTRPAFDYHAYLLSPEWKEKRDLVMWRCRGICEGCASAKAVETHHLTYADVGHEFLWQLIGLCEKCHRRWHQRHGNTH